jgi:hypothetical protein
LLVRTGASGIDQVSQKTTLPLKGHSRTLAQTSDDSRGCPFGIREELDAVAVAVGDSQLSQGARIGPLLVEGQPPRGERGRVLVEVGHRNRHQRAARALIGYYLPKEGANNFALALIDFASLADYEGFRERLAADPDAKENFADATQSGCILAESRSFLRRA